MSQTAYTVVLADDHLILRDGLKAILCRDQGLTVVGEASDGREALRLVTEHQPDLLILDLNMPRSNGLEILADVKRTSPNTRVLVLTVVVTEEHVLGALRAGADGYVVKDSGATEFMLAVRGVLSGQRYLSAPATKYVVEAFVERRESPSAQKDPDALTIREREVLKLVAEGYRNREVGEYLCISEKTVEKHRANLMRKLQLGSLSELIAYAAKRGFISR